MRSREVVLWRWHFWRWSPLLAFLIIVAAGAYGFYKLERNDSRIEQVQATRAADQKERLNQTCELFESDHLDDVQEYKREIKRRQETELFLRRQTPAEANSTLGVFVRRGIPQQRQDYLKAMRRARKDRAPDYCDRPGRGLPEPDPVLPHDPFRP